MSAVSTALPFLLYEALEAAGIGLGRNSHWAGNPEGRDSRQALPQIEVKSWVQVL